VRLSLSAEERGYEGMGEYPPGVVRVQASSGRRVHRLQPRVRRLVATARGHGTLRTAAAAAVPSFSFGD
jgi:hypothetical protein